MATQTPDEYKKPLGDFLTQEGYLGKGSHAAIYRARIKPECAEKYPKIKGKKTVVKSIPLSQRSKETIKSEKLAVENLPHHPGLLELYYHYEADNHCNIICEYVKGYDCFQYITTKKKRLDEEQFKSSMKYVTGALKEMIKHGSLHRDIKPENIVLEAQEEKLTGRAVLVDYGITFFKTRGNEEPKMVAGTKRYWSPEILRKLLKQKRSDFPHPNKESSEHTKLKTSMTFGNEVSEAWALGMTALWIYIGSNFTMRHDLSIEGLQAQYDELYRMDFQKLIDGLGLSYEAKCWLLGLLERNPDKRLTIQEAYRHKWFETTLPHISSASEASTVRQQTPTRTVPQQVVKQVPQTPKNRSTAVSSSAQIPNKSTDVTLRKKVDPTSKPGSTSGAVQASASTSSKTVTPPGPSSPQIKSARSAQENTSTDKSAQRQKNEHTRGEPVAKKVRK